MVLRRMLPDPPRPDESYNRRINKPQRCLPTSNVQMDLAFPSTTVSVLEGPGPLLPEPCESGRVQDCELPTEGGVKIAAFPLRERREADINGGW